MADNVNGKNYDYVNHTILQSRFDYGHLSDDVPAFPVPDESDLTRYLPDTAEGHLLESDYVVQTVRLMCAEVPYFNRFAGCVPGDRHILSDVTGRPTPIVGNELMTVNEGNNPGKHAMVDLLNEQALSINVPICPGGPR